MFDTQNDTLKTKYFLSVQELCRGKYIKNICKLKATYAPKYNESALTK